MGEFKMRKSPVGTELHPEVHFVAVAVGNVEWGGNNNMEKANITAASSKTNGPVVTTTQYLAKFVRRFGRSLWLIARPIILSKQ